MAKLFSGMSQTNFLDELVSKTGKNGHELFDYLVSLLDGKEPQKPKTDETVKTYTGKREFAGSRKELIDLLKLHGADCYGISAVTKYAMCLYAARVFGVKEFRWYEPVQAKDENGNITLLVQSEVAILDEEGRGIF